MSRWHEEFESHPVHSDLEGVKALIDTEPFNRVEASIEQEISRLRKVLALAESLLKGIDQEFFPSKILIGMSRQLEGIKNNLISFQEGGDSAYLLKANRHADEILQALGSLSLFVEEHITIEEISISQLVERTERFFETLDERRVQLQKEIANLKTSATALEKKFAEIDRRFREKINSLDQLSSDWVKQFNETQAHRQEVFNAAMSDLELRARNEWKAVIDSISAAINKTKSDLFEEFDGILNDVKERHKEIRELHGLTAADSISGSHKKSADNEDKMANNWRSLSLIFIGAAASALIFDLTDSFSQGSGWWENFLPRVALTFVLLGGAGYTAQQSGMHRRQAHKQRQFALEMRAIKPYLEDLDEKDAQEVKRSLTEKYFGHVHDEQANVKEMAWIPKSIPDWLAKLLSKKDSD